jgi:plastocyanin
MKKSKISLPILILLVCLTFSMNVRATKWIVNVQNFSFSPSELPNVHVSDTVRWVWVNGSHTTTSTIIPAGTLTWNSLLNQSNQSFEYEATVVGTFNYKCTPHATMGMVGSFIVSTAEGIAGNNYIPSITISPNPFMDELNINFGSNNTSAIKQLRVYDLTGQLFHSQSFASDRGLTSVILNLQDMKSGLYFFEFLDNTNRTFIKKVVKK